MDQVPDETPPEVQPGHLQDADSIFSAYVGFSNGVAHFSFDSSHLEKSSSGFRNGENGTIVVSGSPTTTLSPVWKSNSLEKTTGESNRKMSFKNEFESLQGANHSDLHTSSATKNAEKQMDVSDHLSRDVSSDQIENDTAFSLGITVEGVSYSSRNVQNDEGRVVGRDIGVGSSNVHESEPSCQRNKVCARFSQRRSRKPTLRYIDESSEPNSKHSKKRRKISTAPSATKTPAVGSNVIKSRTPVSCSDESFMEAIQVPFDSQVQVPVESQKQVPVESQKQVPVDSLVKVPADSRVKVPADSRVKVSADSRVKVPVDSKKQVPVDSKKQVPGNSQVWKECRKQHALVEVRDTEMETSRDKLKHDFNTPVISKKVKCSRKHKVWTIAEVRDLIDGVSQYGVGKWTEIKRLLFSSSAHRTPVDLKDKWRNLIKASCAEEQRKKEMQDKKGRNQPWRPLPKSILRRVRELAMIYPCPYNGNSEDLHVCQDSSPSYSAIGTGSPLHIRGQKVHRKTVLD